MMIDDHSRSIGKIISVAADKFVIEMLASTDNFTVVGYDDIHYVARLGGFVIIPVQADYVVSEIIGLREKEASQVGTGTADTMMLDKSNSTKFLDVVPVGMLPQKKSEPFRFGVSNFPSLYADALYILDDELDRVFQVKEAEEPVITKDLDSPTRLKALTIGRSVVFQGYDIKVKLNEFFGGHVAVLGNTGSGKSCTVATFIQSLFEKKTEYIPRGSNFLFFDVNGEYDQAFSEITDNNISVKHIVVDGSADDEKFQLPHWFLEFDEWQLLLQASEKTQQPVLRMALGLTGLFADNAAERKRVQEHFVATCVTECFRGAHGDSAVSQIRRVLSLLDKFGTEDLNADLLQRYGCNYRFGNFNDSENQNRFLSDVKEFISDEISVPNYVGTPFKFSELEDCLELAILYEEAHGNRQIRDYCSQMLTRLKSLSDRESFAFLRQENTSDIIDRQKFIANILGISIDGKRLTKVDQVIVINMNEVDDEVVEVVSAVLSRMVFKLLRQADPRNRFPVNLVLEEAHRYIAEKPTRFAIDATRIFERIAKEGRKYGMFLTVASQRPSELSRTVLSQCSNFVVHRIQNPEDLAHIRQMTPFISDSVLRRLPSLPKQHALIFGNAVNLPTTFKVRDVSPTPRSDDAKITDLWFQSEGFEVGLPLETKKPA